MLLNRKVLRKKMRVLTDCLILRFLFALPSGVLFMLRLEKAEILVDRYGKFV